MFLYIYLLVIFFGDIVPLLETNNDWQKIQPVSYSHCYQYLMLETTNLIMVVLWIEYFCSKGILLGKTLYYPLQKQLLPTVNVSNEICIDGENLNISSYFRTKNSVYEQLLEEAEVFCVADKKSYKYESIVLQKMILENEKHNLCSKVKDAEIIFFEKKTFCYQLKLQILLLIVDIFFSMASVVFSIYFIDHKYNIYIEGILYFLYTPKIYKSNILASKQSVVSISNLKKGNWQDVDNKEQQEDIIYKGILNEKGFLKELQIILDKEFSEDKCEISNLYHKYTRDQKTLKKSNIDLLISDSLAQKISSLLFQTYRQKKNLYVSINKILEETDNIKISNTSPLESDEIIELLVEKEKFFENLKLLISDKVLARSILLKKECSIPDNILIFYLNPVLQKPMHVTNKIDIDKVYKPSVSLYNFPIVVSTPINNYLIAFSFLFSLWPVTLYIPTVIFKDFSVRCSYYSDQFFKYYRGVISLPFYNIYSYFLTKPLIPTPISVLIINISTLVPTIVVMTLGILLN